MAYSIIISAKSLADFKAQREAFANGYEPTEDESESTPKE